MPTERRPRHKIWKFAKTMRSTKLWVAGLTAAVAIACNAHPAAAQYNQPLPSYAQPNNEQRISGRITAINGTYNISLLDDKGYVDSVQLHHGTIINPTGLTLAVGMHVTIIGYNAGSVFEANEIDTAYNYAGPPPPAVYYSPGFWYPAYPYYYWGPAWAFYFRAGYFYPRSFPYGYYPRYNPRFKPFAWHRAPGRTNVARPFSVHQRVANPHPHR
jgi:hypothetical protein